jgi:hypothetical protein
MFNLFSLWIGTLIGVFWTRRNFILENLALRQQLAVLKRRHPRPRLGLPEKLFWVAVRRFWSGWKQALVVVRPETVVRWHRAGIRLLMKYTWLATNSARKTVKPYQTKSFGAPKEAVRTALLFKRIATPTWKPFGTIGCSAAQCQWKYRSLRPVGAGSHHAKRTLRKWTAEHPGLDRYVVVGRSACLLPVHYASRP